MVIAYRGKRWLYLAQRLVGDECADYIPRSFCWPQEVVGVKPPSDNAPFLDREAYILV